jgi:DNA-binding transcriptional MerR regulator
MNTPPAARPVYSMAIAAELLGLAPATLRLYEQKGLLTPARTAGGTRRYSADDVERMRRIADLQADGLHLSGIGRVIDLEDQNEALRKDLAEARGKAADDARMDDPGFA